MIKGWALLANKLREFGGVKGMVDKEKAKGGIKELVALEVNKSSGGWGVGGWGVWGARKRSTMQGRSFAKVTKAKKCQNPRMIWIDVGESLPREAMGTLKFCVVGS